MVKDMNYALAKGLVTVVAGLAFSMMPVKLVAQELSETDKAAAVEQRVAAILATMSVEQKVGQMIQPEIKFVSPSDVKKYHIGSILNGGGSFPGERKNSAIQDWVDLADNYYNASVDTSNGGTGIPIIWGTDAVHGHNNVIGATLFPHNIGLGAANDPQLLRQIGTVTAREVAVTGIDWIFAPTVAVVKDNRWGRTYEGYSSDSAIVKAYAGEIVKGIQGEPGEVGSDPSKVVATAKHWIGDGGTYRGVDQGNTILDLEQLLELHGQGYLSALDADVQSVMVSFNSWNGRKLHGHKQLITDVLKDQLGFDGLVVSDWDGVGQVEGCTTENCAQAINAGIDLIMVPQGWRNLITNMLAQVESGVIPMARIDDAVTRILRVKIRAGLFEKGAPSSRQLAGEGDIIGSAEHRAIARDAVRKSLVLLKNKNQLLPLKGQQHILVTGDGADNIGKQNGGWTITWQGTENKNSDFPGATSIYAGLKQAVENNGGSVELSADDSFVKKPDVAVVVFGEEPYAEGVGDIESLDYRDGYQADLDLLQSLKAKNIPVVAVFLTGRPLWMNAELNSSDAFVVAWLPGSEGVGVADVMVADSAGKARYDFTGRLSFDWPNSELNKANLAMPVSDLLLTRGQGLSYGDAEIIADNLNEKPLMDASKAARIVFSGSARPPFKTYVGDSSNWQKLVQGNKSSTAFGNLTVTTVDGAVQEDSRRVEWTGGRESQFYFQSEVGVDLTSLRDEDAALLMIVKVDKHPKGTVKLRMDCGWPCSGSLNITRTLRAIPEGQPVRLGVRLSCFEKVGVNLKKVNSPFVLVSSKEFVLTIADVRVTTDISEKSLIVCG
jgi:beta-glucosidase